MRVGEDIYNTIKQQVVFRIYKALLLREKRKRRQCRKEKQAKDFTRYFTKKKKSKWPMRYLTSLENSNEKQEYHRWYLYVTSRVVNIKNLTIPSVAKDMEQWELSYIAGGYINWYNYFGEQFSII